MLEDVSVDEYLRARPSAALRPYVAGYSGYRQRGLPPGMHRGLPSPYLTLIFTMDEPLSVAAHPDPGQAAGRYDTLLGGLHLSPATIVHDGRQSGVQVAVEPLACRALFGIPAGELAGIDVPACQVLGAAAARVQQQLRDIGGWPERFAVVDSALRAMLRDAAAPPEVGRAWQRLRRAGGAVTVSALADDVGWSARHLTTRFRVETGLGPKAAARVMRFDRARRVLQRTVATGGTPRLAGVAAEVGYFDQAHLAREFRELAGCSPTRWITDEIGFVQDPRCCPDDDG